MCWVMPPASPATTSVDRIASSSLRLTVVDRTHDRDHRRPGHPELLVIGGFALDVDGEGTEQLAVLVLRRDDLDVVTQLSPSRSKVSSFSVWSRSPSHRDGSAPSPGWPGSHRSCRRSRSATIPAVTGPPCRRRPEGRFTPPATGRCMLSNSDARLLGLPTPDRTAPARPRHPGYRHDQPRPRAPPKPPHRRTAGAATATGAAAEATTPPGPPGRHDRHRHHRRLGPGGPWARAPGAGHGATHRAGGPASCGSADARASRPGGRDRR